LVASKAYSTPINNTTAPLRIGSGAGDFPWIGDIDEVRVWNTARSASDISADMHITLVGNETGLAGYWKLDEPIGVTFFDSSANGNNPILVPPAIETKLYQFNANAGDLFYFDQLSQSSGTLYWRLIDPYGQQVWQNGFSSVGTQALPSSGTFTLLVEGYISNASPINYSFNVQKVTNTTASLRLDNQVSGAISQAGQQNSYTFSLSNPSQLYFDSLTNDSSLNWTLTGPRGTEVSSRSFQSSDGGNFSSNPVLNLIAGNYTLTIAGSGDHTGSYS